VSLSFLALIFVILSIAVNALPTNDSILANLGMRSNSAKNIKSLSAEYRQAAMRCLSADQFLWRHNLFTAQALVLLIYGLSHVHGPAWTLLGLTQKVCEALGCHIDPSRLGLSPVKSEQRRRVWAGLKLLYTIQSTCLGNLSATKFTDTVQLPADLDDDDVYTADSSAKAADANQRPPTKMSYILFKFKLYNLAADLTQWASEFGDLQGMWSLNERIADEERAQHKRFELHALPTYHIAHKYILSNYTHFLRLLLHRQYIRPCRPGAEASVEKLQEQVQTSRAVCRESAMTILQNHHDMFWYDEFTYYRWFVYGLGSFQAFLAASTLVILLANEDERMSTQRQELFEALNRCRHRFEDMSPRSDVCAKGAPILRRLLNFAPNHIQQNVHQQQEPPGLHHHASSAGTSERSEATMHDSYNMVGPPMQISGWQQNVPVFDAMTSERMDQMLFSCPPQMYDLIGLPPEQWLGGASALKWDVRTLD
jgi:hypothetical protein